MRMGNAYETIEESRKNLVQQLLSEMERGNLMWEQAWDAGGMRPYNPVSGAVYLGGNRIRLGCAAWMRGYKDNRWMTFRHAKEKGWNVRKGEKGVLCEKWIFTGEELQENPDTGEKKRVTVPLKRPKVSWFTVFNAEQIDGIPVQKRLKIEYGEQLEMAERFIKSSVCPIIESTIEREAYYRPTTDTIHLPSRDYFRSAEEFLATALHEMAHSTGAKSRLDRPLDAPFGSDGYAREELVAELSAVFTQADLGIHLEKRLQNHAAYLQSWMKILDSNPNVLFQVCGDASNASEYLMQQYERYQKREKDVNVRGQRMDLDVQDRNGEYGTRITYRKRKEKGQREYVMDREEDYQIDF